MISNNERREVARNLREIEERTLLDVTDGELLDFLVETVGFNRYTNEDFDEGLLGRIAELVDRPTYRPVIQNEMEGGVFCPQCGAEIGEYGVPNYCYNCGVAIRNAGCGAEVVS